MDCRFNQKFHVTYLRNKIKEIRVYSFAQLICLQQSKVYLFELQNVSGGYDYSNSLNSVVGII